MRYNSIQKNLFQIGDSAKCWILCLCGLLAFVQSKAQANTLPEIPKMLLLKNKTSELPGLYFFHSVGGQQMEQRTIVKMKYDDDYLTVFFQCLDDKWVQYNNINGDNSLLSKQEAFEIFISNGTEPQEQYLEIQINPNNAVFLGKVNYKYKTNKAYKMEKLDPKDAGILHHVSKDAEKKLWEGYIKLPLTLLDYPEKYSKDTFRMNMYRIIMNEQPEGDNWVFNFKNALYGCWSSTYSKVPQFHNPDRFGMIILK